MGNNQSCNVQGIDDISLKLHDNKVRTLTEVRYVPGLCQNSNSDKDAASQSGEDCAGLQGNKEQKS